MYTLTSRMEYDTEKCAINLMKRGKNNERENTAKSRRIRLLGGNKIDKYKRIFEEDTIKQEKMNGK